MTFREFGHLHKKRIKIVALLLAGGFVLCTILEAFLELYYGHPGYFDFIANKSKYNSIVAWVKSRNIPPGGSFNGEVPASIARCQSVEGESMMGRPVGDWVQAIRLPDGSYHVEFLTEDDFHAGYFGYAYSDSVADFDRAIIDTGGKQWQWQLPDHDVQINSHWWAVQAPGD